MGVQLFAGKFYKCVYPDYSRLSAEDEVQNKTECLSKGYVWYNSRVNFDNTLNAYLGKKNNRWNLDSSQKLLNFIIFLSTFTSCNI